MAREPEVVEELPEGEAADAPESFAWLRNTPYWAISLALHVIVILIMINVVWKVEKSAQEERVVQLNLPTSIAKKDPYDPTKKRAMKKKPYVPGPKKEESPVVLKKEVEEVTADIPLGTSMENLTNVNMEYSGERSTGINDAMGIGGGVAGAYGQRWGKGSLSREGGSDATEEAVRAALEWLMRHQSADGGWKCRDFTERCKQVCTNKNPAYGDGKGWDGYDVGVTGLAVLAFAGYGHTHRAGDYPEYVEVVKKAVGYLKAVQVKSEDPNTNGRFGADKTAMGDQWIYNHAIATMAMAELLVMSGDRLGLKKCVEDATNLCLQAQNPGRGWKYGIRPGNSDTSVTGWMVLALKTAKVCQLDIPPERYEEAFKGALAWFDTSTSAQSGRVGYETPGDPGSSLTGTYPDPYPFSKELSCMTAVGVLCRIFAGEKRTSEKVKRGVDILMKETPQWQEQQGNRRSKINVYYWYYASYAMFQFGGEKWKKWNIDMQDALLPTQRQGGDEDGSWDPIDEWGIAGGRVYLTAIGAMTLEVYYRFLRTE